MGAVKLRVILHKRSKFHDEEVQNVPHHVHIKINITQFQFSNLTEIFSLKCIYKTLLFEYRVLYIEIYSLSQIVYVYVQVY